MHWHPTRGPEIEPCCFLECFLEPGSCASTDQKGSSNAYHKCPAWLPCCSNCWVWYYDVMDMTVFEKYTWSALKALSEMVTAGKPGSQSPCDSAALPQCPAVCVQARAAVLAVQRPWT